MINQRFAVALKAIVISNGRVLVLRRSLEEEVYTEMWDIPGGRMTWGEEPLEALAREVREETGLSIEVLSPVAVWQFQATPELQVVGITFRALCKGGQVVLSPEHDAFRWIAPTEVHGLNMDSSLRAEILKFGV